MSRKVPRSNTSKLLMWGTLHSRADCILIADLDKKNNFPLHIAYTELRPDITIILIQQKKVIVTELTCPREENMEK